MRAAATALVALSAILVLLPAVPGAAVRDADARLALCDAPVDVPGQGVSCPAPGGWHVPLADGSVLFTHGPDPIPQMAPVLLPTFTTGPTPESLLAAPVACVYDTTQPHVQLLYAHPPQYNRHDTIRVFALAGVEQANGILLREALRFGVDLRFKVHCNAEGEMDFPSVQTAKRNGQDDWGGIVDAARAQGYDNPRAKYWIVYDGIVACNCGGQASGWGDDRPGPENFNNDGGLYAISYYANYGTQAPLFSLSQVMLHEAGHTMGAVQNSAPHTTGAFHCTDGADIMCYNDGGPRGNEFNTLACPGAFQFSTAFTWTFDCGFDDYFNPKPEAGSYLATHWNLGSPVNRYLARAEVY